MYSVPTQQRRSLRHLQVKRRAIPAPECWSERQNRRPFCEAVSNLFNNQARGRFGRISYDVGCTAKLLSGVVAHSFLKLSDLIFRDFQNENGKHIVMFPE